MRHQVLQSLMEGCRRHSLYASSMKVGIPPRNPGGVAQHRQCVQHRQRSFKSFSVLKYKQWCLWMILNADQLWSSRALASFGHNVQELFVHQRGILPWVTRDIRWILDWSKTKIAFQWDLKAIPRKLKSVATSERTFPSAKSRGFLHQAEVRIFVLAKAALNPLAVQTQTRQRGNCTEC